jgi:nucleotide-binding universal stress UspA family protein
MTNNTIIVPLDGSALAEKALPFAVALARLNQQKLVLLRLEREVHPVTSKPGASGQEAGEARKYLELVKEDITRPGLPNWIAADQVVTEVVEGRSPHELGQVINSREAAQVVMTTHGRTGLSRLMLGSIARETLETLQMPVFLLRPSAIEDSALPMELMYQETGLPKPGDKIKRQVVVALDGTPEAEAVIQPALELCKGSGLTLCLLRVISEYRPISDGISYQAEEVLNSRAFEARVYLESVQSQLAGMGVEITLKILNGNPATAIVEYVRQEKTSILAMASHTRRRFTRLMVGSVAEEVMDQSHLPVLMMHRS